MKQCIEKCLKGFYTCCANCELANLCEDACHITEDCKNLLEPAERRKLKRAKRTADKFRTIYILLLVGIMLVIGFGMLILGILNEISLNQIENTKTEQSIDQAQKDAVSEDLTPYRCVLATEERELIERVVSAEARGEDLQGQMAVAQTILDRSELWNMTVTEVLTAPDQYAKPYQGEISDATKLAVANVFDGGIRVFEQPVTHFYTGVEPYWVSEKVNRGTIGRHNFLY